MARIIIVGGHGKVALLTASLLTAADHTVTALIRNPDHVADVAQTGATPVVADVEQLSTEQLADLFVDHDAIVWSAGAGGGNPDRTRAVDHDAAIRSMDAAQVAGVQRYVMVSYHGARPDHGVDPSNPFWHYAEAKAAADEHLRSTELAWTVLGPSRLTLDEPTGRIDTQGPAGEVSRANVAQVIAASLENAATIGQTIRFNDGETPINEALG